MDGIVERIGAAELRQLYAHWQELRGGRFAPARRELDPTQIPRLLPYLALVEVRGDGRLRYRLAGTEVEQFFGTKMTGRHLDELASGEYRQFLEDVYRAVIERRVPVYATNTYAGRGLRTARLLLPLSSDGVRVDMVLVGQTFERGRGAVKAVATGHGAITDVEVIIGEPP